MSGQVVAVASGKGGVGKTTTVVNLGVVLRRADHSVAMVDADLGMANLGPILGVTAEHTLHDVLAGEATVEEALVEEAPGFGVLVGSSALTDYPDATPAALGEVLETLSESYDFVLVDTGAGMSHEDVLPLGLADQVLLVATPDPAAIGDTRKTAELAELAEGTVAGLVVTKAEADTDAKHVAREVGVPLVGAIPYDATVRKSTASGQPLEAVDPDTPAAVAYRQLAEAIADGSADPLKDAPSAGELGDTSGADVDAEPGDAPAPAEEPEVDEGAPEPTEGAPSTGTEVAAGTDDVAADEAADPPEPVDEAVEDAPADGTEPADDAEEADDPDGDATESDDEPDEDDETEAEADDPDEDATESDDGPDEDADETEAEDDSAEEEEEDYLAEWEDDEPERSGGFLSRIGRIFR